MALLRPRIQLAYRSIPFKIRHYPFRLAVRIQPFGQNEAVVAMLR
jgi:hypothetical protein